MEQARSMTLKEIQHALAELETRPRQSLGQNFLYDQNLAQWIVRQADPKPGDHLLEIGPGLGSLTQYLSANEGHLTLLEKDGLMVKWLNGQYNSPNVELFHMDALEFDLRKLHGKGPVKIVGNLPYYVSTPLIAKFTSALSPASILVLMLQHEVAARLCAAPGSKDFGAMTICSARRWHVRYARKISAEVFFPRPQVASAIVIFERKSAAEVYPCDDQIFERLVRKGFSERRKQLRKLLPELRDRWTEICTALSVPETVRGEELSLAQWEKMTCLAYPSEAQSGAEMFDVVNEDDQVVERQPRDFVHVNNLRHRAIHIVISNEAGEIFLQKRSMWKDRNPGLWDSSAAGHVDAGESYDEAARRELGEELNIACSLEKIGRLPCVEETGWEFIDVYHGRHEGPFAFPPLEVETGAFFSREQVGRWIERSPGDFSPVFRRIFPLLAGG